MSVHEQTKSSQFFHSPMRTPSHHQKGAVLFISMVMLLVLFLFVGTMLTGVRSEFLVQRNLQVREEMESAGMEAVETIANSQAAYLSSVAGTSVPINMTVNGYTVRLSAVECYGTSSLAYSAFSTVASENTYFDVTATVSDAGLFATGSVQITHGFRIRMPAGSCTVFTTKSPET